MANERQTETPPPVMPPEKARQGSRGVQVLVVLVVALILAMAVWWGVEMYGGAIEPAATEQVGDPETVPTSPGVPVQPNPSN